MTKKKSKITFIEILNKIRKTFYKKTQVKKNKKKYNRKRSKQNLRKRLKDAI